MNLFISNYILCNIYEQFCTFCVLDLKALEKKYGEVSIPNEDSVASYFKIQQQLAGLSTQLRQFLHKPQYILPFLQPGRLLHVSMNI